MGAASSDSMSGSNTATVPGGFAHRHGVDQHQRVVSLEQLVGEVDTTNAVVREAEPLRHLDTEAVVTQEDVADAGHERPHATTSTSSGWK